MNSFKKLLFLVLFIQNITLMLSSEKYKIKFEYLYSDETEIYDLELFNKPKNPFLNEDIFYSGKIETLNNNPVPTTKIINFNKTEYNKDKDKILKKNGQNKEEIKDNQKTGKKKEQIETNVINLDKEIYQKSKFNNKFQDGFEEGSLFDYFFNDNENFNNIRYRKDNQKQKRINYNDINNDNYYNRNQFNKQNYYNNQNNNQNYYNNHNEFNRYNKNGNINQQQQQYSNNFNNNKKQFIYDRNSGNEGTIRIIKYPGSNTYIIQRINNHNNHNYDYNNRNYDDYNNYNNKIVNNNNNNDYNKKNNKNDKYKNDPFSIMDDFDFNFDMEDPFQYIESRLKKIYGIRFLEEKNNNNNTKKINSMFSSIKYNLLFIPNKSYLNYIPHLPKSTILIIPKIFTNQLTNYEDYYIFTIDESISFDMAIAKAENNRHIVKIGKNFSNSNLIFIIMLISIIICLISSIVYSYLLKKQERIDILPIQHINGKLPQFLCVLNILILFSFIASYYETQEFYIIIKYISLFLYSLFRSIFLSVLILLLNGWMTLSFRGWWAKLNKIIPILIYEVTSSIFLEAAGFYNLLPYNKLQLYYFKNLLENIIIASLALLSMYKYYIPLNQKCKYLSLINSEFNKAYKLKKTKLLSFIIFGVCYASFSIYSNYIEFDFIYKYIQRDTLHYIKLNIFESVFNVIFLILLLPMKLPYLFTEETELISFGYFFTSLNDKREILDVNNKKLKSLKKKDENQKKVPIIVVNPFFKNNCKNGFDDLHTGKVTFN